MKILRHRLHEDDGTPVAFVRSPNSSGALTPQYLVVHYTAGRSAADAIRTLTDPAAKASAHLVIGRDGAITQLVPFDRVAWHAGRSRWMGLEGINRHSLGIELDNAGKLMRQGDAWRAWFDQVYDAVEVIEATHQHESEPCGWHVYTPAQLDALIAVGRLLVARYDLRDMVGHDDIAPGRKIDPGPAFPMDSVRARVFGRRDDAPQVVETIAPIELRDGPGIAFAVTRGLIAPQTRFTLLQRKSYWCYVELAGAGGPPSQGWVSGDFIRPV